MKRIGLTGGIGVGKTYIADVFKRLKIPVFNADIEAKKKLTEDQELKNLVKQHFGQKIYKAGSLQKQLLADIVFNDPNALKELNAFVHPIVKKEFIVWSKDQDSSIVIKEAAILFESDAHLDLDVVICVSAPKNLRINRIQERDSLSLADIRSRIKQQMAQSKKEKLADYIIVNDGKRLLLPQILNILKEIS